MPRMPQITSALVTYTADEAMTRESIEAAHPRADHQSHHERLNFKITEMHTRHHDQIYFLAIRFRPRQYESTVRALFSRVEAASTMRPRVYDGLDSWLYMGTLQMHSPQGIILRNIIRDISLTSYFEDPSVRISSRISILHDGPMLNRRRTAAAIPAPVAAERRSPRLARSVSPAAARRSSSSSSSSSDDDHMVVPVHAGSISIVYADASSSSSSDEEMADVEVAAAEPEEEVAAAEPEEEVAAAEPEEEAAAPAPPSPYRPAMPSYSPQADMVASSARSSPPLPASYSPPLGSESPEDSVPSRHGSTSAASSDNWTQDDIFRDINARLHRLEASHRADNNIFRDINTRLTRLEADNRDDDNSFRDIRTRLDQAARRGDV